MKYLVWLPLVLALIQRVQCEEVDAKELRCLVCKITMEEFADAVRAIDPTKKEEIGNYRLDSSGNAMHKMVSQSKSEIYLSDLADSICNRMDDYVRAKWKSNGELLVMRLIEKGGGMNPIMSEVDIIQDGDLNKSLKYYCEGILEEQEEGIIKHFQNGTDNIDVQVCTTEGKFCSDTPPDSEEEFRDEL